jgi:hypothetical protein
MLVPIDQIPLGEGILPDGGCGPFYVDRQTLTLLQENGHSEKYSDARFLLMAVTKPDAIFKGLRRPNQLEGLCYSIRPEGDPDDENSEDAESHAITALPRYGAAFLAFIEIRVVGYVAFDWEWRDEDPDMPGYPLNWADDFGKQVYP